MKVTAKVTVSKRSPMLIIAQAFGTKGNPGPLMLKVHGRCHDSALKMAQELRDSIYKQRLRHMPLSPAYLRLKIRKGLDPRVLISTKKYIQAIGVIKTPTGAMVGLVHKFRYDVIKTRFGVRIRKLSYAVLAKWLEYGTRQRRIIVRGSRGGEHPGTVTLKGGMPPRPHWRPAMKKWKQDAGKLRREIVHDIRQDIAEMLRKARQ